MATLWRYLRLYGYFVAFSFSRGFEFRFDFVMRIVMDVLFYTVSIAFFKILYLHTPTLGGWTEPQMMLFVSAYIMVDAINMTVFANNLFQFPELVNRGDLDYYLIRPVSTLFFISLRDFAANSFVNLLITVGIFVWALLRYPAPVSAGHLALFLLMVLNGNFIFYCINMMFNLPVFFTQSGSGYGYVVWTLGKFTERPDRIYTGLLRRVLTTGLPFALIASFPTRFLLEEMDWPLLLQTFLVSASLFGVLLVCWSKALAKYGSASS